MSDQRRRRGPRGDITADGLAAAATAVLATVGPEGLSLRAVAREAGVTPTAIYTYYDDMAALRNRVGDDFLGRLDLGLLRAGSPEQALHAFLDHGLALFANSPGSVALLASQRIAGPHSLALNEALLDFFVDRVGHDLPGAVAATALVVEWVHGASMSAPSAPVTSAFRAALSRVDPARHPRTVEAFALPADESAVLELLVTAVTTVRSP